MAAFTRLACPRYSYGPVRLPDDVHLPADCVALIHLMNTCSRARLMKINMRLCIGRDPITMATKVRVPHLLESTLVRPAKVTECRPCGGSSGEKESDVDGHALAASRTACSHYSHQFLKEPRRSEICRRFMKLKMDVDEAFFW